MPGSFMCDRLLLCEADKPFQMPRPYPKRKKARGSIASGAVRIANAMEAGDWREACKAVSKGEGSERGAFATDAGC
jgi:hypothetical protein